MMLGDLEQSSASPFPAAAPILMRMLTSPSFYRHTESTMSAPQPVVRPRSLTVLLRPLFLLTALLPSPARSLCSASAARCVCGRCFASVMSSRASEAAAEPPRCCSPSQKSAVAVAYARPGKGLVKLNGALGRLWLSNASRGSSRLCIIASWTPIMRLKCVEELTATCMLRLEEQRFVQSFAQIVHCSSSTVLVLQRAGCAEVGLQGFNAVRACTIF